MKEYTVSTLEIKDCGDELPPLMRESLFFTHSLDYKHVVCEAYQMFLQNGNIVLLEVKDPQERTVFDMTRGVQLDDLDDLNDLFKL